MRFVMALLLFSLSSVAMAGDLVNLSYLDHLSTEMKIEGEKVLAVAIYANAPDYEVVDEPAEGFACVDDVARAAVLLMDYHRKHGCGASLQKARAMIRFVLKLQCPDGLFYNFVYPDGSINRYGKTSRKKFDFWTSRGMWVLGRAVETFKTKEPAFARRCERAARLTLQAFTVRVLGNPSGFQLLCGNDCWSEALLGIVALHRARPSSTSAELIHKIAGALSKTQAGNLLLPPFGALTVWSVRPCTWHGWGNRQALALIEAGRALKVKSWIDTAKAEVKVFHRHLLNYGLLASCDTEPEVYPQIAYTLSPLIQSAVELAETDEEKRNVVRLASWFFGNNSAGSLMYDKKTGRCYDGIDNGRINVNGGAESTIEALFAMMALEEIPIGLRDVTEVGKPLLQRILVKTPLFYVKKSASFALSVCLEKTVDKGLKLICDNSRELLAAKDAGPGPHFIGKVRLSKGRHRIDIEGANSSAVTWIILVEETDRESHLH